MEFELQSMSKNRCKPIGCKWVYETKRNSKGQIDRYKAILVAKGFTQQEGVNYNETFSPVSTKDSLRVIMALVAHFDLHLHQMDVQTAFLNGNLIEEIYMKQPDGFIQKGEEDLASRQWYLKFDEVVKSQGFIDNPLDECIYQKFQGETLHFHAAMTDLGEANYVLGIEISQDRERGLLSLSQKRYIERILKRFNMENCTGCDFPFSNGDKLSSEQSPKTEQEKLEMQDKPYASLVGSLMYAQVCTRPDLAFSISVLGRFQSNPGGAVAWKSVKQQYISTSTMQAEFLAIYEATSIAMWLKKFMSMLKVVDSIQRPIQLWNDNSAAVYFAKGNKRSGRLRHLQLKFLSAKENI
ncbi:unnamed protein product [Prunus armeniaca]